MAPGAIWHALREGLVACRPCASGAGPEAPGPGEASQRGALRLCAPGESYSDIILRLAKT